MVYGYLKKIRIQQLNNDKCKERKLNLRIYIYIYLFDSVFLCTNYVHIFLN